MKEIAEYKKYQVITVPDVHGVNCLYINSTLVHCSRDELFNSAKVGDVFFIIVKFCSFYC